MKIAFWDLECSNLQADYGQLLCGCVLEYAPEKTNGVGRMHTFELPDYKDKRWNDLPLALAIRDELESYDIVVGYNSIRFDQPFLNTRLEQWSARGLRSPKHLDLMYTVRYKLRLHSSSLQAAQDALKLTVHKTRINPTDWVRAMGGDHTAYRRIIFHCKQDVRVLAELYGKTKHLVREIK